MPRSKPLWARSVDSELSGNMIDICPVGALTSKPFRYSARTWELSRRKSVSPHDSTGANLVVQVKNNKVMRVVPLENEAVNECWIADRDRFCYEALEQRRAPDATPMLEAGRRVARRSTGRPRWNTWPTACKASRPQHGAAAHRRSGQPAQHRWKSSTSPAQLVRGLGSDNIDHRLRHAEFHAPTAARTLARHCRSPRLSHAGARARGRLQPAQGPSAVCPAHSSGCAQARLQVQRR